MLASKGDSRLGMGLRRHEGRARLTLLRRSTRPATEIAALYKARWQIELLFGWLKQHLAIRRFPGHDSVEALRLQLVAAMITFALLRLALRRHCPRVPILRVVDRVEAEPAPSPTPVEERPYRRRPKLVKGAPVGGSAA